MRTLPPIVLLAVTLLSCNAPQAAETAQAPDVEVINLVDPWPYPFSSAVRVGNMLYLSGQVGTRMVDGAPQLVPGGIEAEARQAMENIREVLEHAGSSMDRVVKCMVMMADMADWPTLNEVYSSYFPGPKPARSSWGATGLALGARVEITCFATVA